MIKGKACPIWATTCTEDCVCYEPEREEITPWSINAEGEQTKTYLRPDRCKYSEMFLGRCK